MTLEKTSTDDNINHRDTNGSCNSGHVVADVDEVKTPKFIYTQEEEKLVRKINFKTVPFICLITFLQYLDKATLNYSAVMGIYQDTKITGNQFGWLGSIFYLGYLLFQVPNQYFLQRFPISKYLGVCLVIWGVVLGCTPLAKDFSQLAALRFLQGFFEAAAYPSLQLLISTVYRRSEQILWFGALMGCTDLASTVGGLIGFGFWSMHGAYGLSGWKWCMLILGCITVIVGVITFFFMPDKANSKWYRLTFNEIAIVESRMRDNTIIQKKREINRQQIFEALQEPRFYSYMFICFLVHLVNGCVSIFTTTIIKNMGFSDMESILLNIPVGFSAILLNIMSIYLCYRFNENNYIGAIMSIITFIGILFLTVLPIGGSMLTGILLITPSPVSAITLTVISNNVSGYTKKVFYNGAYLVVYCLGNFTGPLMIRENEAPRYLSGMVGYMTGMIITIILFLYTRWTIVRDNRYRQRLKLENKLPPPPLSTRENELDYSDGQNLRFLYRP
ncbi:major facilitator superfamily domain-containing protein [Phascolomyces articulosus]|uniref:Major facilitator superfamily domain-containing protein n=1 Tax=Phascolomyces articulosus TaxID=60185 RepID=A0AAD5PJ50_9FUNG|nr:major facilitator superfamily domain-containing protein [Phascolomyces articulosus]